MKIISLAEAKEYLTQLNLDYIINSMCSIHYPLPRWRHAKAEQVANQYKNFLFLQKKSLPFYLVPSRDIDEFWHNHILYTKKYFADCQSIFGHYLHHEPANPEADTKELITAFEKTKQLYFAEFNSPLIAK